MNLASIGKTLAGQAIEGTKNHVMEAMRASEAKPAAAPAVDTLSGAILGQIQAMQRPLTEEQELAVSVRAGDEMLRVLEIFVPGPNVLVFAGYDAQGAVMRFITPVETAQVVCKIKRVPAGARAARVNILTPKPRPEAEAPRPAPQG